MKVQIYFYAVRKGRVTALKGPKTPLKEQMSLIQPKRQNRDLLSAELMVLDAFVCDFKRLHERMNINELIITINRWPLVLQDYMI